MVFKLYFYHPFTGNKILRQEFTKYSDLVKAWTDPVNSDYILEATKEEVITKLPKRPRAVFEEIN